MRQRLQEPHSGRRSILSLRVKLTVWMLAIFFVIQVCLIVVLHWFHTRSIEAFFNDRMRSRLTDAGGRVRPLLPDVSDALLSEIVIEQIQATTARNPAYHLLRGDGSLLATSYRPGFSVKPEVLADSVRLHPGYPNKLALPNAALGPGAGDQAIARGAVLELHSDAGGVYYLVLANSDAFAQQLLALLRRVILISVPIGLIATGVSAYLIAGVAVRPFAAIGAAARRIAPDSAAGPGDVAAAPKEVLAVRAELELARQRIEQGFAAQERFMSNVSHELKTPIATILTQAQVLRTEDLSPAARAYLSSQAEELEKLADMVDSLLLLIRIRHGKARIPAAAKCYVRDVLVESYAACAQFAASREVRIELVLPDGDAADAIVVGNCDLLRIIFDNLIRNAIRFSPSGAAVSVTFTVSDQQVHVTIRDRGPGIAHDLLPRLFDRFSQALKERPQERGHGLGLEIALGIAELHAGSIRARNCDDSGCEFTVTLPVVVSTDGDDRTLNG